MLRAISNKYMLGAISTGGSRAAATSKMEWFVIIVNRSKPLTIITKRSILDVAAALDLPLIRFLVSCKERWKDIKTEISWFFMTDSYILEKVFRTLIWDFILIIGLFVNRGNRCIFCIVRKNSFRNTVIYSIHQWLRKHFRRYFKQFRRNFISSCSLFDVYIFKKLINFRSCYTITLKLFYSL